MTRSAADLSAIKSELTHDPLTLGLTVLAADDEANANKLNLVRNTIQIKRRSVAMSSVFGEIDPLEHQSLSDQQARWLDALIAVGQIDPLLDAQSVVGLNQLFGVDSNSRPAIASLLTESGSRINQLFQAGTVEDGSDLTPSDISQARGV